MLASQTDVNDKIFVNCGILTEGGVVLVGITKDTCTGGQ